MSGEVTVSDVGLEAAFHAQPEPAGQGDVLDAVIGRQNPEYFGKMSLEDRAQQVTEPDDEHHERLVCQWTRAEYLEIAGQCADAFLQAGGNTDALPLKARRVIETQFAAVYEHGQIELMIGISPDAHRLYQRYSQLREERDQQARTNWLADLYNDAHRRHMSRAHYLDPERIFHEIGSSLANDSGMSVIARRLAERITRAAQNLAQAEDRGEQRQIMAGLTPFERRLCDAYGARKIQDFCLMPPKYAYDETQTR